MLKVISKGYTITVVSYENDGDNYQKHSLVVETIEEAKAWYDMMQLCSPNILGNDISFSPEQKYIASCFIRTYKDVFLPKPHNLDLIYKTDLSSIFVNHASKLLGDSEDYVCRAFDKATITFSPEDVYAEEIKFNPNVRDINVIGENIIELNNDSFISNGLSYSLKDLKEYHKYTKDFSIIIDNKTSAKLTITRCTHSQIILYGDYKIVCECEDTSNRYKYFDDFEEAVKIYNSILEISSLDEYLDYLNKENFKHG